LFGSINLLLSFILAARLFRLRVSVDPLVTGASALAIGLIVVSLAAGWMTLDEHAGRLLVVLIAASFALAGLDTLLQSLVALPLDEELREDGHAKTRSSGRAASIE
jgi:hypothetical protein